jgi:hypothetical protein
MEESYTKDGHCLDPELFGNVWKECWLEDSFLEIVRAVSAGQTVQELVHKGIIDQIHPGIYSFPIFRRETSERILSEAENYQRYAAAEGIKIHRPNSMNNYGLVLNLMGMREILTNLQQNYLVVVSRAFFPSEASEFTDHHSFM